MGQETQETIDVNMQLHVKSTNEADALVRKMLEVLEPEELEKIKDFKLSHTYLEVIQDAE